MARWKRLIGAALSVIWLMTSAQTAKAQPPAPVVARPLDGVAGIVKAFETHDVVALDEGNHNNLQGAAFREALYRDPRFQRVVGDIVVESGNGHFQAMMDRYILGAAIPEKELRKAWLDTTQPGPIWDKDIYAQAFRTIREINRALPRERKLRVLLGDTPSQWGSTDRFDAFPAELVLSEVRKHRKVLIVYGGMHFLRRSGGEPTDSIVTQLEKSGVKVFSIWTPLIGPELTTLQPEIVAWAQPSLTLIKGTTLGTAPFTFYYPNGSGFVFKGGARTDLGEAIGGSMQDQFDALLYLGPKAATTYAKLSASLCADPEYVAMRAARMNVMRTTDGRSASDEFKASCAAVVAGR